MTNKVVVAVASAFAGFVFAWLCVLAFNALPFENRVIIDATGYYPVLRVQPKACAGDELFRSDVERYERECALLKGPPERIDE